MPATENSRVPALTTAEVFAAFASRPDGLSAEEAGERRRQYGKNELPRPVTRSLWRQLLHQLTHFMAALLWLAGLLAFVAGIPELGWATWAVVVINAAFSFWQEYRADKALAKLAGLLPRKVKLRRGGQLAVVEAEDIVVGDVVVLEAGDRVPADARVVEADKLAVDLSLLNGESLPVERGDSPEAADRPLSESANLVFAGTTIVAGRGMAVVYAVGRQTEFGRVSGLTAELVREKSPLELQIQRIVRFITAVALVMGGAVFGLAVWWVGLDVRESFIFCIGIIVANVPEGLLPTVSLSLAVGVQRMAGQNALVRRLSAVEALSATTVICTDKTGTITLNEITAKVLWVPGRETAVDGTEAGEATPGADFRVEVLLTAAVVCSDAELTGPANPGGRPRIVGDPTEAALLEAAVKRGVDVAAVRAGFTREFAIPFDSSRKMMSVGVLNTGSPLFARGGRFAFVKGAPLEVLDCCRYVMKEDGYGEMSADERRDIAAANDRLAGRGYRVLALAWREFAAVAGDAAPPVEQELIFVGLAAMIDPPRPEAAAAIALCRQAGVRVTMITGDYGVTAAAIGRQIGLVDDAASVITGAEVEKLADGELQALLGQERPVIFARANPEHKLKIVAAYKAMGQIVAVTGDGVNDAPALRAAHVGIAMGRGGTDVAREVADIVLLDDNFATIVKAIEQGRAIYDNIRKFVTYILSSNIPEIVPFIAMVLLKIPPALTILQILAIDIGTDMLPALALGAEKPEKGVLRRQPASYGGNLLDARLLLRSYGFLGLIEAALSLAAFFAAWHGAGYTLADVQRVAPQILYNTADTATRLAYQHATTMALAAIIACQIGNLFVCRSEHLPAWRVPLGGNWLLWLGIGAEIAITAGIIYVPFLAAVFLTQPLTAGDLGLLASCPVILVALEEARRFLFRRVGPNS